MTEMTEEMKESRCDVMLRNNWDALFFIFETQFFQWIYANCSSNKTIVLYTKKTPLVLIYITSG